MKHPNGSIIYYNDEQHKYWTDNCPKFTSVTTVIDSYFPKFDSDTISKNYAKKHKMKQEDVLEMWKLEGVKGSNLGNNVHNYCENFILGKTPPKAINKKAGIMMKNITPVLVMLLKNYEILGCEKILFSEHFKIAGTIDLLVRNKRTNKIHIIDWKTNKQIKTFNYYKKFGFYPIEHIADTNFYHYCLQTSLYKYLILHENYYNEEIITSICHISHGGKIKPYDTTYYKHEIDEMLHDFLKK